ncbi:MAG: carbamoyltransferase [Bryobacterales bacterium]|nr:carbamoyltransferase [Bryobacterales bacterium]
MVILGIGGLRHDAAAAIARDGVLAGAVEEAKLVRNRPPGALPLAAVEACLDMAGVTAAQVDCVALVRPLPSEPADTLHLKLRGLFPNSRIVLVEHHVAHAASAYFASPFEEATVLTLDRAGDFRCGARWFASGNRLTLDKELFYPDSLGDLYGRVTELLGFQPGVDEHKVQWLSASGDQRFGGVFRELVPLGSDGWPRVERGFIDSNRLTRGGFSGRFFERLGIASPAADDGSPVPPHLRAHVAAGLQQVVEQTVLAMAQGGSRNLCLAGGIGYNALLAAALEHSGAFDQVFVQPAAGNAGTALGGVFHTWHEVFGQTARLDLGNFCLGPGFDAEEIKRVLENCKLRFRYLLTTGELMDAAVSELNEHKIVAWMHGRMEFGPRALGNRSILASPLDPYSTENLNTYIKRRETFRKFAASVPAEVAGEYFEVGSNARYLVTVGRVRPAYADRFRGAILADDLVRVHTVEREHNPLYWRLLHAAGEATGLPVLYNTSFNLFGEPLVCTPRDAVRSFFASGVDSLFVGNFLLQK